MVVRFDQDAMKVAGEPTTLTEGMRAGSLGAADLAISETGTLVYATGGAAGKQELVWVTRDGNAQSVDPDWQGQFVEPVLSPDGTQVALGMHVLDESQIWVKQLDRGPIIRLTLEGSENYNPAWTADGRSVTFTSTNGGSSDLWTKRADGSGPARLQVREPRGAYKAQWTNPGGPGAGDILGVRPGIDTVGVPLVATRFTEVSPAPSPDGRWLAYTSSESGQNEVYVVPLPNTGAGKWVVSRRGGGEAQWSRSGKELFYRDGAGNLVAVEVRAASSFSLGPSVVLFPAGGFRRDETAREYAVSPDGRRFLMIRPLTTAAPDKLIVVENWFEELQARSRK
jgi:serine/threonine-protein kinase